MYDDGLFRRRFALATIKRPLLEIDARLLGETRLVYGKWLVEATTNAVLNAQHGYRGGKFGLVRTDRRDRQGKSHSRHFDSDEKGAGG